MYSIPSTTTVILPIVLIALTKLLHSIYKRFSQLRTLPGPPLPSLLYGHELQIRQAPTNKYYVPWMKEYGHAYKTRGAFSRPILNITDPKAINYILSNTSIYNKDAEEKVHIQSWFGKGVITAEGEDHKRMRKMLNVAFTPQAVREVSGVIFDLAERLKTQWEEIIDEGGNQSAVFNVTTLLHQTTLDAICRTAFMYDCQANTGSTGIPSLLHQLFTLPIMDRKTVILRYLLTKYPILLALPTPMHMFAKRIRSLLGSIAKEVWVGAKNSGGDMHAKLLDALVSYGISEGVAVDKEQATVFIIELLFAGSETTSNILTECTYELAWHQEVQKKLRDELIQFEATHGRQPAYDDLMSPSTLPYLDAVVRETLRTKAVQNHINRQANKTDIIPLRYPLKGTKDTRFVEVQAGQRIEILVRDGINVAEDIWGPDARAFRPERWLQKNGLPDTVSDIHAQGNMLSFGDGSKVCLGRQFALAEVRILLAMIVRYFTFDHDGMVVDCYYPAGDTIRPYIRGRESEGAKMLLRVGKYDGIESKDGA